MAKLDQKTSGSMGSPSSLLPLLDDEEIQFVFVGGKGGVGKTTSSSAIAVQFAKRRPKDRILLISTDPAHNLSDAFCQQFSGTPEQVHGLDNLWACEVDPETAVERDVADIKRAASADDEGGSTEMSDIMEDFRSWISNVPGIDEAMALSTVLAHVESGEYKLIVFDTAPTGHTIRLLQLPSVLKVGLEKLQSWKARLGGVIASVSSLVYKESSIASQARAMAKIEEKLAGYKDSVSKISEIFRDNARTQFVCVCIAQFLSVYETQRLVAELDAAGIACRHVLVNLMMPRSLSAVTPETGGAQGVYNALVQKCGMDEDTARAVQEACELCGARSRIQQSYLKVLQEAVTQRGVMLTLLPLLPAEVRGVENLTSFSQRLVRPEARLSGDKDAAQDYNPLATLVAGAAGYEANVDAKFMKQKEEEGKEEVIEVEEEEEEKEQQIRVGDRVEIYGLVAAPQYNGKFGTVRAFKTERGRVEIELEKAVFKGKSRKAPKKCILLKEGNLRWAGGAGVGGNSGEDSGGGAEPALNMEHVTPDMMQLVMQLIQQPGGIQKMLQHPLVEELKKGDDEQMKAFFTDIETLGVFGGFKYMSNKHVMGKLAVIAKAVLAEG